MPAVEGGAATDKSPPFIFADEFPPAHPAHCSLTHQIEDLVQRYLRAPLNKNWSDRWLELYDQQGVPRRAIYIIQVWSSDESLQSDGNGRYSAEQHSRFADGFDAVAEAVFEATKERVGFVLDALCQPIPPGGQPVQQKYYPVSFYPSCNPDAAFALSGQQSLLAVGAFIPENTIFAGHPESERVDLKRNYLTNWAATGVPIIMDLTIGYDGHLVFQPGPHQPSGIWGNNASWQTELLRMKPDTFTGVTFNTWNGYTEGYAVVPTTEFRESAFRWVQRVTRHWFDVIPGLAFPGRSVTPLWQTSPLYLRLFVTDVNGSVWMTWWEPGREWTFWDIPLTDKLRIKMHPGAEVTAVWRQQNQAFDLFVTGTDGAVWSLWWNDIDGWRPEGWILIHPEIKMQPGATVTAVWADPGKHLDLFVIGTDGAVWTIWWDNLVGWRPEGWIVLHPEIKMQPGANVTAVWAPSVKHLDLFVTDALGFVWSTWYDANAWRPEGWFKIGDSFAIAPGRTVTALWSPDPALKHIDLYSIGTAGQVVSAFWEPELGW
jgi:hypothetical protein